MTLDKDSGLLLNAVYIPSPNYNFRPIGTEIDLIVIHNISLPPGEFGGPFINELFTNTLDSTAHPYFAEIADMKVSSHFLIRRDGMIIQYVPLYLRAWHAGQSSFLNRDNCNDFSIGIELEGTDTIPYAEVQYEVLAELIAVLLKMYPKITRERIVGHSTVAPERKTDPGPAFNWLRLMQLLESRR